MRRKSPEYCITFRHAWEPTGVIVVLKGNEIRMVLECDRCGAIRKDVCRRNGLKIKHTYDLSEEYRKILSEHDAQDVRESIISGSKETRSGKSNNPHLRLLPNATARRRHAGPVR
jgi:hypothetical protein